MERSSVFALQFFAFFMDFDSLPASFLSALHAADPAVRFLNRSARAACPATVSAALIATSPSRYEFAARVAPDDFARRGVRAIVARKVATGDPAFSGFCATASELTSLCSAAVWWACEADSVPVMRACFGLQGNGITARYHIRAAAARGSVRVLAWFRDNHREDFDSVCLPGWIYETVRWAVETLDRASRPAMWLEMRLDAWMFGSERAASLLDWVTVPRCEGCDAARECHACRTEAAKKAGMGLFSITRGEPSSTGAPPGGS